MNTGFDPFRSNDPLIVYIDFKSPYAFIAKDPTYAIADQLGIEIDWRALTLDIPSYLGSARLDADGRVVENNRTPQQWSGVKYAYRDARRYASLRGLTLRGTTKIWDSSLAGIGMHWAKRQGSAVLRSYIDRVYERFWKRELDIEDPRVIERMLEEAGADTAGFAAHCSGEGRTVHDAVQQQIFDGRHLRRAELCRRRRTLLRARTPADGALAADRQTRPGARYRISALRGLSAHATNAIDVAAVERPTVCIDFKNPKAYLALSPTYAMQAETGVEFDWLPLIVSAPGRPPDERPGEDRGARHRRMRARYYESDLRRYARVAGARSRRYVSRHGYDDPQHRTVMGQRTFAVGTARVRRRGICPLLARSTRHRRSRDDRAPCCATSTPTSQVGTRTSMDPAATRWRARAHGCVKPVYSTCPATSSTTRCFSAGNTCR